MTEFFPLEWINALLRWLHVLAGLAWVGASFYLISWENKFNRRNNLGKDVEGDFWTIQGGDFYFIQKMKSAPQPLPEPLHWFKYEAYFTWLTGFALMCLLYYTRPESRLLHPDSPISGSLSPVLVSVASLVLVWVLYSLYCRTRWARNLMVSAVIGVLVTAIVAWGYNLVFTGYAAIMHLGAAMGTIMSANVFFSIIPWHKQLIAAARDSKPLEEIYRTHPGFRSRHNHYLTLPVLFLMLAGHAPFDFNSNLNWLVTTLLVLAMGLFKHFHTCIQRKTAAVPFLLAGLLMFSVAVICATAGPDEALLCSEEIPTEQVNGLFNTHCSYCHNANAGQGLGWKDPQELLSVAPEVINRVFQQQSMPPGNFTNMSEEDRLLLACWLKQNGGVTGFE